MLSTSQHTRLYGVLEQYEYVYVGFVTNITKRDTLELATKGTSCTLGDRSFAW